MQKTSHRVVEPTFEQEETGEPIVLQRQKSTLINYFRQRYIPEVSAIGAASQQETHHLLEGLLQWESTPSHPTEEEVENWSRFRDLTQEMLHAAHTLFDSLHSQLLQARNKGLISSKSMERWIHRFQDPSTHYKQKEYFIQHQLPSYIAQWEAATTEREKILQDPTIAQLTSHDIPDLNIFLNREQFLDRPFPLRKGMNAMVAAALRAREKGMQNLYQETLHLLSCAASGSSHYLHTGKVGLWLKRIFEGTHTEAELRTFLRGPFERYRKQWMRVRNLYDVVTEEMEAKGTPRGFWIPSVDTFLSWHFTQRETYIEEAKLRLRGQREEPESLTLLKVRIRHDLDTKDWEGAAVLLEEAQSAAPGDIDLSSMRHFLAAHRDKKQESEIHPNPQDVLDEMRTTVQQLPSSLRWLYIQALMSGYSTFTALTTLMYNRVWCHRNGHLTEAKEAEQAQNMHNKQKTQIHIQEGHEKTLERNIVAGTTAEKAAIRQECMSPQVLYIGEEGMSAVLSRTKEQKNNWGFRYWTTIIPLGLEYGLHAFIVEHFHLPLKKSLRFLENHGLAFSLVGTVEKKSS